jgi:hypothetical protein
MITGSSLGHRQALFFGTWGWQSGQAASTAAQVRRAAAFKPRRSARQQAVLLLHLLLQAKPLQRYGASAALFAAISAS